MSFGPCQLESRFSKALTGKSQRLSIRCSIDLGHGSYDGGAHSSSRSPQFYPQVRGFPCAKGHQDFAVSLESGSADFLRIHCLEQLPALLVASSCCLMLALETFYTGQGDAGLGGSKAISDGLEDGYTFIDH